MDSITSRFSMSSAGSSTNSSHATLQNAIIIDMGCTTDTDALSFSSDVMMTPRNDYSMPLGEVCTSPALCQSGWDGHSEAFSEKHNSVTPGSPDSSRTLVQRSISSSGTTNAKDTRGRSISCGVEGTHSSLMAVIEEAHFAQPAPREFSGLVKDVLEAPEYSDRLDSLFASSPAGPRRSSTMYRAPQRAATLPQASTPASVPLSMPKRAFTMPEAPQAGYLGAQKVHFPGYPDTPRTLVSPSPSAGHGGRAAVSYRQKASVFSPSALPEKATSTSEDYRVYSFVHLPGLSTPTDLVPRRRRPLTYTILAVLVILIILLGTAIGVGAHSKDDSQPAPSPHTRIQ